MSQKTTAQVLRKDGTFAQVRSWKDLKQLERAGEIDVYSTVVADEFVGAVGELERDFFAADAANVALRVLAIVAVVLALLLGVAILVKATRRSSTENTDSPPTVETSDWGDAESDAVDPFDAEPDAVAVERWASLRELYDEMRETAALLTPKNSTKGSNV